MTSHELHEMRAGSQTRHNTSTLESQSDTSDAPRTTTSHQDSPQPSISDPASAPTLRDRLSGVQIISYLFRTTVDDRWAESLVGKALVAASEHHYSFQVIYVLMRKVPNTHLNVLFDMNLSLSPIASNHSLWQRFTISKENSLDDCLGGLHRILQVEHTDSFIVW